MIRIAAQAPSTRLPRNFPRPDARQASEKKDVGILFSAPMVRAIGADAKTRTRRLTRLNPAYIAAHIRDTPPESWLQFCPYGPVGRRLWVRETWFLNHVDYCSGTIPKQQPCDLSRDDIVYRADGEFSQQFDDGPEPPCKWRVSIHMPRWVSRYTLEVTAAKLVQLHDMTDAEAVEEGATFDIAGVPGLELDDNGRWWGGAAVKRFATLWDSINADRSPYAANPYVWDIAFKRVDG